MAVCWRGSDRSGGVRCRERRRGPTAWVLLQHPADRSSWLKDSQWPSRQARPRSHPSFTIRLWCRARMSLLAAGSVAVLRIYAGAWAGGETSQERVFEGRESLRSRMAPIPANPTASMQTSMRRSSREIDWRWGGAPRHLFPRLPSSIRSSIAFAPIRAIRVEKPWAPPEGMGPRPRCARRREEAASHPTAQPRRHKGNAIFAEMSGE
jgi:hypothetical protein